MSAERPSLWIHGRNAVREALDAGVVRRLRLAKGIERAAEGALRDGARAAGVAVEVVPRIELDRQLGTTRHQGVAAELPAPEFVDPEAPHRHAEARGERLLLVLLDGVQDPHNYGAIVRSAEAFGAHGVVTEARRSAPLGAGMVKASAGAALRLPLLQVKNLPRYMGALKERNVWLYGADVADGSAPTEVDWERDVALVIGSEGRGLRRLVREGCDARVRIPLHGRGTSLNASVAAGVLLYAARAGRGG